MNTDDLRTIIDCLGWVDSRNDRNPGNNDTPPRIGSGPVSDDFVDMKKHSWPLNAGEMADQRNCR